MGAHDVVGGGNGGSNIGDGSWSSEIGGEPLSMRGTAALATVPAHGEVDAAIGAASAKYAAEAAQASAPAGSWIAPGKCSCKDSGRNEN